MHLNLLNKVLAPALLSESGLVNNWHACLVCLADMPFIKIETYRSLASQLNQDNIVIPFYQKQAGNPVGFGRLFLFRPAKPQW